jgi:hypothetical protein
MPLPLHLSKVDILKLLDHFPERPVADLSHLDLGRQLGIRKTPVNRSNDSQGFPWIFPSLSDVWKASGF